MEKYKSTTDRKMWYVFENTRSVKQTQEAVREVARITKTPALNYKAVNVWIKDDKLYTEPVNGAKKMLGVVKW